MVLEFTTWHSVKVLIISSNERKVNIVKIFRKSNIRKREVFRHGISFLYLKIYLCNSIQKCTCALKKKMWWRAKEVKHNFWKESTFSFVLASLLFSLEYLWVLKMSVYVRNPSTLDCLPNTSYCTTLLLLKFRLWKTL